MLQITAENSSDRLPRKLNHLSVAIAETINSKKGSSPPRHL
ncbi:MAG: hypothetical protein SAJ37_05370 [Oscillatoria sp. PMC 1068.18]|nr:hypothetical protein [Oscillatoria sp. PMC 1076.18]MEC4988160.1 hypothetical protein [Oscillatoria sp. PMC 1068.18]